jgi:hypothetical protein
MTRLHDAADPRIGQLVEELAQARGETLPFLVWSGSLPPGDEAEAVNLLFREPRGVSVGRTGNRGQTRGTR